MINEYKAPDSNVETITGPQGIETLPRFSAWGVLGLTIITLGIYPLYWLYKRTEIINEICENEIPQWLSGTALVFYTLGLLTNMIPDQYYQDPMVLVVAGVAAILNVVFYIWWILAVRTRLQMLIDRARFPDFNVGPVLTFFFQTIYLQYKINQYIDQQDA